MTGSPATIGEMPARKRNPPPGGMNRYPMTTCGRTTVAEPDAVVLELVSMVLAPAPAWRIVAPAPSSKMFCFEPIPS